MGGWSGMGNLPYVTQMTLHGRLNLTPKSPCRKGEGADVDFANSSRKLSYDMSRI